MNSHMHAAMDARITALEQIALSTKEVLGEIKAEMRGELKAEMREMRGELKAEIHELRDETKADIRELRQDQKSDFRLTFGALITVAIGLAAVMAQGFKWF